MKNPLAFTPMAVTILIPLTYFAIIIPLLVIHETVPPVPRNPTKYHGLNTTEAWLDLTILSSGYHPYNSHKNDEVREWLLRRIEGILSDNGVHWGSELEMSDGTQRKAGKDVVVFNDLRSNVTTSAMGIGSISAPASQRAPGQSVYFEGTNIMVYIRGTEDEEGDWWAEDYARGVVKTHGKGGVLVNAHYDSVATGYGATDDGVGVVTVLQLIKYFTTPGNQPKKGVLALLNNGEEDFLNGIRAFTQHPMSEFAHTFLNLEGAGAGGRATLFRSTDAEVTRAYQGTKNPFGTIITGDFFKSGFIRSQTDYVIMEGILGLRGLDLAFWEPRARYHTDQDDARHTSVDSLWHMLEASVTTMKSLTKDTSSKFVGERGDGAKCKLKNGKGSDAVWFDLFGKAFAVFGLRSLFAWSLTLLIAGPLILIVVTYLLIVKDKYYFFAGKVGNADDEMPVSLNGRRGLFRFPVAFVFSTAIVTGLALLVTKINPFIVYSSSYAVWSMMLSAWFISFWFVSAGANFVRPSALARGYAFLWMFILGWIVLVAVTVFEDRFKIASGYFLVMFESVTFLAALISLLELFALPTKEAYASLTRGQEEERATFNDLPDNDTMQRVSPSPEEDDDVPTETTPLFGGDGHRSARTTFANYRRSLGTAGTTGTASTDGANENRDRLLGKPFGSEPKWSSSLPTWTWILQFLLVGPFMIAIYSQLGLFLARAVNQTGVDGSALLAPYTLIALFTVLLLLPTAPFINRFTHHIPTFLLFVFIGTTIYNLTAFPFSSDSRYKAFFQQSVDIDSGINSVSLVGIEPFIREIISTIPSASGQKIDCSDSALRSGLTACTFTGLDPNVVPTIPGIPPSKAYANWMDVTTSRTGPHSAKFNISAKDSRACVLRFDRPIFDFTVDEEKRADSRFERVPEAGSAQIKLWKREWDASWSVEVQWNNDGDEKGMEGSVVCLWSEWTEGLIPALDEVKQFAPDWAVVTKLADGLVEGVWKFVV